MSLENRAFQRVEDMVSQQRQASFALGAFSRGAQEVVHAGVDPLREWNDRRAANSQFPSPSTP